jgi:hypothetical protein
MRGFPSRGKDQNTHAKNKKNNAKVTRKNGMLNSFNDILDVVGSPELVATNSNDHGPRSQMATTTKPVARHRQRNTLTRV